MEERGEEVGPDVPLEVRVDEVTAVDGSPDGGGGEVEGFVVGGGWRRMQPLLGGERAIEAVGYDGGRAALAAQTRLD